MIRLDIGTAEAEPGWTAVDRYAAAAVRADMAALPYPDGSVVSIRSSHALEHAGFREVSAVLAEWRRVLMRWGTLWVMVPTLDYCCEHWLTHEPDGDWSMQLIFGSQDGPGQHHRSGFTAASLRAALVAAGFEVRYVAPTWSHGQRCLVAEAFVA